MPGIIIIADDLTGAADSAVAFAARGVESAVLLGKPGGSIHASMFDCAGAVAIDADTRCLDPDNAAITVEQLVTSCCNVGVHQSLLFKKVDSTLRGNVAAELRATLEARRAQALPSARVVILFAPAFPALGRTTVNGCQMLQGQALEPDGAGIVAMFRKAGLSCALMDLAQVRSEASALANALTSTANIADVLICDAETEDDLHRIAAAGSALDHRTVWAGSAGLAHQLARTAQFVRVPGSAHDNSHIPEVHGPTLFAVGSPAGPSREQAFALAAARDIACFTFVATGILAEGLSPEWEERGGQIRARLARGQDVLLRFDSSEACSPAQGRPLARALARMIHPCADHVGALVATGGETARAILDAWGIERLRLGGEVEPGLPWSLGECGGGRKILVLTKAGSFGERDTLLHCREFLRN